LLGDFTLTGGVEEQKKGGNTIVAASISPSRGEDNVSPPKMAFLSNVNLKRKTFNLHSRLFEVSRNHLREEKHKTKNLQGGGIYIFKKRNVFFSLKEGYIFTRIALPFSLLFAVGKVGMQTRRDKFYPSVSGHLCTVTVSFPWETNLKTKITAQDPRNLERIKI
jgi:hypothetical protein